MPLKKGNVQMSFVLTKEERAKIKEIAEKESRSISKMIAHIIRQYLDKKK